MAGRAYRRASTTTVGQSECPPRTDWGCLLDDESDHERTRSPHDESDAADATSPLGAEDGDAAGPDSLKAVAESVNSDISARAVETLHDHFTVQEREHVSPAQGCLISICSGASIVPSNKPSRREISCCASVSAKASCDVPITPSIRLRGRIGILLWG